MRSVLALGLSLSILGCMSPDAEPELESSAPAVVTKDVTVLRMRSLAPSTSKWAISLRRWADDVREQSGGSLSIEWTWNGGGRGEEAAVLELQRGALDGAALTSTAIGGLVPDYRIFGMPGLFASWRELDAARSAERAYFDARFADAGVVLLGQADIGAARIMGTSDTYEGEIWRPENLRGKALFTAPGDVIGPELLRTLGVSAPVLSLPEVMGRLGSSVNVLVTAPYAAVQLQWSPRIKYILRGVTPWFETGGMVVSKARFDALSADQQQLLIESARELGEDLQQSIRGEDASAYAALSRSITRTHEASAEDKARWADAFRRARAAMAPQFSPELVRRVCGPRC